MDVVIIAWTVLHMNIRCYSNFVNIARYNLWINYLTSKSIWLCIIKQTWMATMNISSEKQVVLGVTKNCHHHVICHHQVTIWLRFGNPRQSKRCGLLSGKKVRVLSKELEVLQDGSWWGIEDASAGSERVESDCIEGCGRTGRAGTCWWKSQEVRGELGRKGGSCVQGRGCCRSEKKWRQLPGMTCNFTRWLLLWFCSEGGKLR